MVHALSFDILGIGNAILDVQSRAEDPVLAAQGMTKGAMALVDAAAAARIYAAMGPGIESSGGSVANSCAVAAGLGAQVAFLGKVADDALGETFRHDIMAVGVHYPTPPLVGGAPTARCMILVSPDGQRTMNTYLGACVTFGEADLDQDAIAAAKVTYLEGYLFDPPAAQAAFRRAARIARAAGRRVAISLSDPFCVGRHRADFREFVRNEADILFANEAEVTALYEVSSFEEAAELASKDVGFAALTRSEKGSVVIEGSTRVTIAAHPTKLVDSTGAGDAYAAGFLTALTRGKPVAECGRWGSIAAAEVISHFGARPQTDLRSLIGI